MTQQLRYIVEQLNAPPFSRHYNLVSFDSLDSLALLQILNDVLADISPENKMDLREEPPDQTALRMFSLLRILKYKPKTDEGGGLNTFRHGLLQGEKGTIYPLLQWLLEHSKELKKRAYLAKFLVRIDVPAEFLQEEITVEMHTVYQELVEQFKELHRTVEQQRYTYYMQCTLHLSYVQLTAFSGSVVSGKFSINRMYLTLPTGHLSLVWLMFVKT